MDTDDLTPMANETLSLAYEACEPMRAEIGMAAADYRREDDFLAGVAAFLEEILEAPDEYLESWNLADEVELTAFVKGVKKVHAHVISTLRVPLPKRGKPPFEQ